MDCAAGRQHRILLLCGFQRITGIRLDDPVQFPFCAKTQRLQAGIDRSTSVLRSSILVPSWFTGNRNVTARYLSAVRSFLYFPADHCLSFGLLFGKNRTGNKSFTVHIIHRILSPGRTGTNTPLRSPGAAAERRPRAGGRKCHPRVSAYFMRTVPEICNIRPGGHSG